MANVYKVRTLPSGPLRFFSSVDDIPGMSDETLEDLDALDLDDTITVSDRAGVQYQVTYMKLTSPPGGEGGSRKKSAYKKMHTRKHRGGRRHTKRVHKYREAPRSRVVFQMAGRKTRRHRRL